MKGGGNILSVTAIAINPGSMASARNSTLETFRKVCPLLSEDEAQENIAFPQKSSAHFTLFVGGLVAFLSTVILAQACS